MDYTPSYWDSEKGKVIKAIALDWCFTFWEVQERTEIEPSELYDLIGELMSEDVIYCYEDQYRIVKELYHEYWDYAVHFTDLPEKIYKESQEIEESLREVKEEGVIQWVKTWIDFQRNYDNEIKLNNDHFYLDGCLLPNFIHDIVRRANEKIIYVAPWIEEIGVTKNLVNACKHGKIVTIVTREPFWSTQSDWGKRQAEVYEKCHSNLLDSGVRVCYNNEVHGKVLLVDDLVAVVSSFNLLKNPASGLSWEAGVITFDLDIVKSITDSINGMKVLQLKGK